jgi:hypothetical protein
MCGCQGLTGKGNNRRASDKFMQAVTALIKRVGTIAAEVVGLCISNLTCLPTIYGPGMVMRCGITAERLGFFSPHKKMGYCQERGSLLMGG